MDFKKYYKLEKYIDGHPTGEYKSGDLITTDDWLSLELCESGAEECKPWTLIYSSNELGAESPIKVEPWMAFTDGYEFHFGSGWSNSKEDETRHRYVWKNQTDEKINFEWHWRQSAVDLIAFAKNIEGLTKIEFLCNWGIVLNPLGNTKYSAYISYDLSQMFYNCKNLKEIKGLELLRVNNPMVSSPDTVQMFYHCESLEDIDLSWITALPYAPEMFYYCTSLKSVNLDGISTRSNKYFNGMFGYCVLFENFDLSKLSTSSAENMERMFIGCKNLKEIKIDNIATGVKSLERMFSICESLEDIDVKIYTKGLNSIPSSLITISGMFSYCRSLKNVSFGENFSTESVTNMSSLFRDCSSIKEIDISSFDTGKLTNSSYMFYGCSSLERLNLENFNTSKITNYSFMFSGTFKLSYIRCSQTVKDWIKNKDLLSSEKIESITWDIVD